MIYLYETLPPQEGGAPRMFELPQDPDDAPYTVHPETGEAIRRVILGGWGAKKGAFKVSGSSGDGCGSSGCC
jgi:hypothetical protein